MAGQLTWYDILDVLPGSPAEEVQRAFDKKAGVLRPELIAAASPTVVAAAGRARTALETGRQILTDPASRQRHDAETGIRQTGGGLCGPQPVPSRDPWSWNARGGMDTAGMDALGDWLAPHAAPPRRIAVPDVRGLLTGPCRRLSGDRGLHVAVVRLTRTPMPAEGLVVDQSPLPGRRIRRPGTITVQAWHPPRQTRQRHGRPAPGTAARATHHEPAPARCPRVQNPRQLHVRTLLPAVITGR